MCFSVSHLVAQRWAKQRPGFLGSMRKFHLMTVFVASGFALSACSFSTDALWPALSGESSKAKPAAPAPVAKASPPKTAAPSESPARPAKDTDFEKKNRQNPPLD